MCMEAVLCKCFLLPFPLMDMEMCDRALGVEGCIQAILRFAV